LLENANDVLQLEVLEDVSWTGIRVRSRIDLQLIVTVKKRTTSDIDHLHEPMAWVGPRIRGDRPDKIIVQPDFGSICTSEASDHEDQDGVPVLVATPS